MTDRWIVVPNWDKFQHYKDRDPVWIKVYFGAQLDRDDCRQLSLAAEACYSRIWIVYARI